MRKTRRRPHRLCLCGLRLSGPACLESVSGPSPGTNSRRSGRRTSVKSYAEFAASDADEEEEAADGGGGEADRSAAARMWEEEDSDDDNDQADNSGVTLVETRPVSSSAGASAAGDKTSSADHIGDGEESESYQDSLPSSSSPPKQPARRSSRGSGKRRVSYAEGSENEADGDDSGSDDTMLSNASPQPRRRQRTARSAATAILVSDSE